jgi:hypothetical protein
MNNKKIRKWLRSLHRDLGYLFVGIILIYAISGILLNHKITAFSTSVSIVQLERQQDKKQLEDYWTANYSELKLKKVMPNNNGFQIFVKGGVGEYNSSTGKLEVETYKRNIFINFVHRLHYNTVKGWKYIADIFAVSLIFFAISGMFLTRGKKSLTGRGKWLILIGICITLIIYFL